MTWAPEIQVFDQRPIKDNLIGYITANQVDALAWARGSGPVLPPIKGLYKSPRLATIFPAFTILQTEHSHAYGDGGLLVISFSSVFELAIIHGSQDTLTDNASKYAMALESMLANIPETTFSQNSNIEITSTIREMETAFDIQGKIRNKFVQISQTRAAWTIEASIY